MNERTDQQLLRDPDTTWQQIAPHLDAALGELSESDRDALLLRYFERKSASEMAQTFGISDEAAQKRVNRAVARLRDFLAKRGITVGASGLVVSLSANAVQAAPAGLAVTISTAATLAGASLLTTAAATATQAITMTALQKTLVTATAAVLVGTGIYEARQASRLRSEVHNLQQQQAPLAEQARQLQFERDDASNRLALLSEENVRLQGTQNELLRLRGEVGRLRQQVGSGTNQAAQDLPPSNATQTAASHSPGAYISKDQLANAGYATPEAAMETMMWTLLNGTYEQATEWLSPKMLAEELKDPKKGREEFEDGKFKAATMLKGIQIMAKKVLADDKVELKVRLDEDAVAMRRLNLTLPPIGVQPMVRVGDAWKLDSDRPYQESWDQEGQIQSFFPK